jgi:hypothetical protein
VGEQHYDPSDDERLVREALLAAYPTTRSQFSQRRGEQIIRAAALEEHTDRRSSKVGRVAASITAVFTLLAGSASAAGAAMPGHPLYPLKRMMERAMIAVTSDDDSAARLELRFAERRLVEASVVGTEEPEATSLAEKFHEHIRAAAALGGEEVAGQITQLQRSRNVGRSDTMVEGTGPAPSDPLPSPVGSGAPAAHPSHSPSPMPAPSPSPTPSETPSSSPDGEPPIVEPTSEPSALPSQAPRSISSPIMRR